MATVNFFDSFSYKWAQTGTAYAWDDAQYKQGWATIGAVPPSVEQFNRVHQVQDEKLQWLFNQLSTAAVSRGVTLSGGDVTGLRQILDNLLNAVPAATTSLAGKVQLATQSEVDAGTNATKSVTPATLVGRTALETRPGVVQLASVAEARAMTDFSKALTPARLKDAFSGNKLSLASNGYQILPSGVIIQWAVVSSGTGAATYSWPIAFPTAYLAASVTENAASVWGNDNGTLWGIGSATKTTFRVTCRSINNGGSVIPATNAAGIVISIGV